MDDPPVALGISVDHFEREHRQHKTTLHRLKQTQKFFQVPLIEGIFIMAAVGVHIGRINEMKGIRRIIAGDHVEGIAVLDRYPLKPRAELLRELILRIAQFLDHRPGEVIPKRAVHHRGK